MILSLKREALLLLHTPVSSFSFSNLKATSRNVQTSCVCCTFVHIHTSTRVHTHNPQTQGCITDVLGCFFYFFNMCFLVWSASHRSSMSVHRMFMASEDILLVPGKFLSIITKVNHSRLLECYCAMWWKYFYIKGL